MSYRASDALADMLERQLDALDGEFDMDERVQVVRLTPAGLLVRRKSDDRYVLISVRLEFAEEHEQEAHPGARHDEGAGL